ncbi:hypothetical protein [Flagellimonas amoyensis]|uniref:hypothetical protein n=1 Tax=Flagellimonas amoyensis TaxID=2169401 RepID=UPI000D3C4EB8|nr:hypothetical protein [Allomuricauda amoyensis]
MGPLKNILLFGFLFVGIIQALAQPYTLDKSIKPMELKLMADTRKGHEGEKGIVYFNRVTDSVMYHFVTGHSLFQFVDVLVTSMDGSPLEVSLNQDIWNDEYNKKSTASSEDNMVRFKLRAEGKFGIKVETDAPKNSLYNITVLASPEKKAYLGSAFRPINENEMKSSDKAAISDVAADGSKEGNGSNTFLYIALGVALLVIGLLAGKLLGRKGKDTTMLLCFMLMFSIGSHAQQHWGGNVMTMEQFENWKTKFEHDQDMLKEEMEILQSERAGVRKGIENLGKTIANIQSTWSTVKNLYTSYTGLSDCINSAPPAGAPTIPSICSEITVDDRGRIVEGENEECASCFLEARQKFNEKRYLFDRLATIYKCTKKFSNAAIAFGDNASGVHGVAGLAWQAERIKIEKSVEELEKAYDNKYAEMLQDLADAMMELNICEAKYGVEDWYDRFGYMYFEFMKEKYARKD